MQRRVKVDNKIYTFPADATDQEISSHLSEIHHPMQSSLKNEIGKIPEYALNAATSLPSKLLDMINAVPDTLKKVGTNPIGGARDVLGGGARNIQNLAGVLLEGGEYVTRKGAEKLGKELGHPVSVPKWNAREFMGLEGNRPIDLGGYVETKNPDPLLSGIGQYGLGATALGSRLLPFITSNAINSAIQANPQNRVQAATEGAVNAGIPALASKGIRSGVNALRPSKILEGNLSPQELENNLRITQGTETGLGDIIGSPFLKRQLENMMPNLPFSGANEAMQRTGQKVVSKGENILSNMLRTHNPENIPEQITKDLVSQFKEHRKMKNSLYEDFNKEADKQFIDNKMSHFASKAKEYKDAIESTNILKFEPTLKNILSKLGVYEEPIVKVPGNQSKVSQFGEKMIGEPLTTHILPNLKEANLLKGKLNEYKNIYKVSPGTDNRFLTKIFGELHEALKKDIDEAVEKSGNPKLKSAHALAEKNYKENYSKFLDKDIYKYLYGDKNPETIVSNFVKTSSTMDLAGQISKISSTLPDQSKSLLSYSYFSRALDNEGNLNPAKLGTLIEKLKPNQFKALVPDPNLRNQLKDYSKLQHMNKEAQNLMFNPKTGQRSIDTLIAGGLGLGGKLFAGNLGALGLPIAALLAGKGMTKLLTNEKIREALVKKMIQNKRNVSPAKQRPIAQSLQQGLINAMEEKERD